MLQQAIRTDVKYKEERKSNSRSSSSSNISSLRRRKMEDVCLVLSFLLCEWLDTSTQHDQGAALLLSCNSVNFSKGPNLLLVCFTLHIRSCEWKLWTDLTVGQYSEHLIIEEKSLWTHFTPQENCVSETSVNRTIAFCWLIIGGGKRLKLAWLLVCRLSVQGTGQPHAIF